MDHPSQQTADDNHSARTAWDANAPFWDAQMGDGNDFFRLLEWPPVLELLAICAGEAQVVDDPAQECTVLTPTPLWQQDGGRIPQCFPPPRGSSQLLRWVRWLSLG